METTQNKVPISAIPKHGLFIYKKEVWRSLGKLIASSKSYNAQRVALTKGGYELATANADFSQVFLVRPYFGEIPMVNGVENLGRCAYSVYQDYINTNKKSKLWNKNLT